MFFFLTFDAEVNCEEELGRTVPLTDSLRSYIVRYIIFLGGKNDE